ncbi:MAG: hypothetical protein mread185_000599 [Mycoplasmataceae bacterium]|nr:MAG: hypothetical protein mread185_000599 [Mycoplasmataceae bacterium]
MIEKFLKNFLPILIINKNKKKKYRDYKLIAKNLENNSSLNLKSKGTLIQQKIRELNDDNQHAIQIDSRKLIERGDFKNTSRKGSGYEGNELNITSASFSEEFNYLKYKEGGDLSNKLKILQKESDVCPNISYSEWETIQKKILALTIQLSKEKDNSAKLKNKLDKSRKDLNDLRQDYKKSWEWIKILEITSDELKKRAKYSEGKSSSFEKRFKNLNKKINNKEREVSILNFILQRTIKERDSRPDITVKKWEEFQKQITNLVENAQADLIKAKNTITNNLENFSEITNNYWESVQKKVNNLKEVFWFSADEQNSVDIKEEERVQNKNNFEKERNKICENYFNMHQINQLKLEVINEIKNEIGKENDLVNFEIEETDYENKINQFSKREEIIAKKDETLTLISLLKKLIEVNEILKDGKFDLIDKAVENSKELNNAEEEDVLPRFSKNYEWEKKFEDWSWSRQTFIFNFRRGLF